MRQPERFERLVLTGVGANLLRHDDSDAVLRAIEVLTRARTRARVAQYFAGLAGNPVPTEALAACLRSPRPPLSQNALVGRAARFSS